MQQKPNYQQTILNEFDQLIGLPLIDWTGVTSPQGQILQSESVRLEPLDLKHGKDLWQAISVEPDASCWTYLPYEIFTTEAIFNAWLDGFLQAKDIVPFAIIVNEQVLGWCALMRIDAKAGSIEVGHVYYSSALRQTKAATEVMLLLINYVFSLRFRRCEWKCNDLNEPSRKAALRLGFQFEGIFRQAMVIRGHNRNTAWFSILDEEWPQIQVAMQQWLSADNFDLNHQQKQSLNYFMGFNR
jgi:RimJ/RimL family protein N-acetyltransferase